MKEGVTIYNPVQEQHDILSGYLHENRHERLIPLCAAQIDPDGHQKRETVTVGYAIADDNLDTEALIIDVGPTEYSTNIELQGDRIKERLEGLGKRVNVEPVSIRNYSTNLQLRLIGWRIHTIDELQYPEVEEARRGMISALSTVVDSEGLQKRTDTELCLMMLLMQHKDIGRVHEIMRSSSTYRIRPQEIEHPIRILVDDLLEKHKPSRYENDSLIHGQNPM